MSTKSKKHTSVSQDNLASNNPIGSSINQTLTTKEKDRLRAKSNYQKKSHINSNSP